MTSQDAKRRRCATDQAHNGSMPPLTVPTRSVGKIRSSAHQKPFSRSETSISDIASSASTMVEDISQVIVVGAGPTGLTAALELAYRGVPSVVLDAGMQRSDGSRAIAVHRTALMVWERLGCAAPMLAEGIAWRVRRTFCGDRELYAQVMPAPMSGDVPAFLNLPQYRTEDCLIRAAQSTPLIDLRWQHRIIGVNQDPSGVSLQVETPAGLARVHAAYVLACDGARSSLRKLLGLEFRGRTYPDRFLIADIRAQLPFPSEPRFFFNHPTNPGSTILIHPQPHGVWRIDWQLGRVSDITPYRNPVALERRIRGLLGDVPYELVWLSDYRFHQRLLDRLRHGRIFFLGDAAHLVAPFGARGMNSAIHDVENLAWKLAWVLHGEAPESLLDTYEKERHPALRRDQQVTNATMRFMAPRTRLQRLRRTTVLRLSTQCTTARRWVNSGKMSEPFTDRSSPILIPDTEPRRAWFDAPQVGAKAPDVPCTILDGANRRPTWLRHLVGAGFLALYFARSESMSQLFSQQVLRHEPVNLTVWPVLTEIPNTPLPVPALWDQTGKLTRAFTARPGTLFLIRPDGHLAARRRHIHATELIDLIRLASGNKVDHLISGSHSNAERAPCSSRPTSLATLTIEKPS
jgi:3-(3-hydroxy-phenyl)propionate hydroxylase